MQRILAIAFLAGSASVTVADPSACLGCHAADEFSEMDAATIKEVLADPGIPPHGRFVELSEEEIQALLDALQQ